MCCSIVVAEWMFELASKLNAANHSELLLLLNHLLYDNYIVNMHVLCNVWW